eukprot:gene12469-345_t
MVGQYLDTLDALKLTERTIVVATSDHGDMQMEHRQFYKMVAYEASSRVPLVVAGPGITYQGNIEPITQHVDLLPTFLDLAGGRPASHHQPLSPCISSLHLLPFHCHSCRPCLSLPYVTAKSGIPMPTCSLCSKFPTLVTVFVPGVDPVRGGGFAVSQFHGENLAMSWYMVRNDTWKYVVWGTGHEDPPQLFNLASDPNEDTNLALDPKYSDLISSLDIFLRKYVEYPSVSNDVASYNVKMANWWVNHQLLCYSTILDDFMESCAS